MNPIELCLELFGCVWQGLRADNMYQPSMVFSCLLGWLGHTCPLFSPLYIAKAISLKDLQKVSTDDWPTEGGPHEQNYNPKTAWWFWLSVPDYSLLTLSAIWLSFAWGSLGEFHQCSVVSKHRITEVVSLENVYPPCAASCFLLKDFGVETNATGRIHLKTRMASAALDSAFSAIDANNDGVITREEFMAAQRGGIVTAHPGRPPLPGRPPAGAVA